MNNALGVCKNLKKISIYVKYAYLVKAVKIFSCYMIHT